MATSPVLELCAWRRILPWALAAVLSGCASNAADIRRPLVVDRVPEEAGALATLAGDMVGAEDIRQSLDYVRWDLGTFFAKGYGHGINMLGLKNAGLALGLFPENPYAWIQVGADLALMNQTTAAVAAYEKGLELIARAGKDGERELAPLRTVALLSLANAHLTAGENEAAFEVIIELEEPPVDDPVHRLAYHWICTQIVSDLGEPEEAREHLQLAREIPETAFANLTYDQRTAYPQFFEPTMRQGLFLYVEGLIAFDARDYETAIVRFEESEKQAPRLWESSFALANVLFASGRFQEAASKLLRLEEDLRERPKRLYRRERVSFNLGNVYLATGNFDAAIRAYRRAIDLTERREQNFRRQAIYYLKYDQSTLLRQLLEPSLEEGAGIFSEAYNNLGNAYARKWLAERTERLRRKAEESYERALENRAYAAAYVARTNLAVLEWRAGSPDEALDEIEQALSTEPGYAEALDALLAMAGLKDVDGLARAQDSEIAARACSVWLDAVAQLGPRDYVREQFAGPLASMRQQLATAERGPEVLRALGGLDVAQEYWSAAETLYRQAAAEHPRASWPWIGLARIEAHKESPDQEALQRWLSKALEVKTRSPGLGALRGPMMGGFLGRMPPREVYNTFGAVNSRSEPEGRAALADLRDAHYLRGRLKLEKQDWAGARTDFEAVLELNPRYGPALAALDVIDRQGSAPEPGPPPQ